MVEARLALEAAAKVANTAGREGGDTQPAWMDEATARGMLFALPILNAQIAGERQWCAWCMEVDPGRNMGLCVGCYQFGEWWSRRLGWSKTTICNNMH